MDNDGAQQAQHDGRTRDGGHQGQAKFAACQLFWLGRFADLSVVLRWRWLIVLLFVLVRPAARTITASTQEEDQEEEQREYEPKAGQRHQNAQRFQVLIVIGVEGDVGGQWA